MVELVDLYFQLGNWNFGETFYFTELSAFLHQKLAGDLASVVIVPENSQNGFGDLFEVHSTSSEIFISTLDVNSIDVVKNYTVDNLKIG
jgi:phage terminase Nu1 subunit (DNA packaging protein)